MYAQGQRRQRDLGKGLGLYRPNIGSSLYRIFTDVPDLPFASEQYALSLQRKVLAAEQLFETSLLTPVYRSAIRDLGAYDRAPFMPV